jgi:4-azaleucine resistance transporter AzlC
MRDGIKAGLPIAAASFVLAISFGVLAQPVMGNVAPIVMSAIVFAGSAQFAALAVLSAGGGVGAAILAGILLNARYIPMGVALAPSLRGGPVRRAAVGQTMIDASWAMSIREGGLFDPDYMIGATFPNWFTWVGGTAVGVFAGDLIADPEALGLDALFPAFFLALLVTELGRSRRAVAAAGLGAVIALTLAPLTTPGVPVIAACFAALIALWPDPARRTEPA